MVLFFNNSADAGLLILRVIIGIIFLYHGIPKLFNANKMSSAMGWHYISIFILGLIELLSAFALFIGLYAQIAGVILSIVMIGAIYMKIVKWKIPFSSMKGTGWEFDLMILGGILAILFLGAGNISLDYLIGLYP